MEKHVYKWRSGCVAAEQEDALLQLLRAKRQQFLLAT
jgi:hypothetical protein